MEVHQTGVSRGSIRAAACKEFHLSLRDQAGSHAKEKEIARIALYNDVELLCKSEQEKKRKVDEPSGSVNPRILTVSANLKNVTQSSIEKMLVHFILYLH